MLFLRLNNTQQQHRPGKSASSSHHHRTRDHSPRGSGSSSSGGGQRSARPISDHRRLRDDNDDDTTRQAQNASPQHVLVALPASDMEVAADAQESVVITTDGGATDAPPAKKPANYQILSVLSCIFCFCPTGLIAIWCSMEVDYRVRRGDMVKASRASRTTKTLIILSVLLGVITAIVLAVLYTSGWAVT
ncbi:PREDICTED: uncharacterized protein LOC106806214 [Priapulus caudatus]|uniref:Uncharacterized protein LOC106806214 n=1 Tax=Priapulus caudatus TaxID=37621 RepID=A0ABM1DUF3_PRICU|nr:PREDICTED: uncharacterized protein LOC106806214 [Priapulus caudatus]